MGLCSLQTGTQICQSSISSAFGLLNVSLVLFCGYDHQKLCRGSSTYVEWNSIGWPKCSTFLGSQSFKQAGTTHIKFDDI